MEHFGKEGVIIGQKEEKWANMETISLSTPVLKTIKLNNKDILFWTGVTLHSNCMQRKYYVTVLQKWDRKKLYQKKTQKHRCSWTNEKKVYFLCDECHRFENIYYYLHGFMNIHFEQFFFSQDIDLLRYLYLLFLLAAVKIFFSISCLCKLQIPKIKKKIVFVDEKLCRHLWPTPFFIRKQ